MAAGVPLTLRLLVPLWVVNATPLPLELTVVKMAAQSKAKGQPDPREAALDAASVRMRELDTDVNSSLRCSELSVDLVAVCWHAAVSVQANWLAHTACAHNLLPRRAQNDACCFHLSQGTKCCVSQTLKLPALCRPAPESIRAVKGSSVGMVCAPLLQLQAFSAQSKTQHGVCLQVSACVRPCGEPCTRTRMASAAGSRQQLTRAGLLMASACSHAQQEDQQQQIRQNPQRLPTQSSR